MGGTLLLALVLTGAALAGNGGISPPAKSPMTHRINDAYWLIFAITAAIGLVAFATRERRAAGLHPVAA